MNDDASSRGGSRLTATTGYYPTVDELLEAISNETDYKALTAKLTKDFLHCLLKDTLIHLKQARKYSVSIDAFSDRMDSFNATLLDNQKQQKEFATKLNELKGMNVSTPSTREQSLPVTDDKYLRQLKITGIPENNEKYLNDRLLKDKQIFEETVKKLGVETCIEDCKRLGRYTEGKSRPLLVTMASTWDQRLCKSKVIENDLYRQQNILFLPELSADKIKEKSILRKRYQLIQEGHEKSTMKIRNLKLYLNGNEVIVN